MKSQPIPVTCHECGAEFRSAPWRVSRGIDRYCSRECRYAFNEVRVEGDVAYLTLTNGKREPVAETLMDLEDLEFVKSFDARVGARKAKHGLGYYAKMQPNKKLVHLHRVLAGAPDGMQVDHRNGNGLDNRTQNLRFATNAENLQNLHGPNRNSASGVRGVCWDKKKRCWLAYVTLGGRHVLFKRFKTKEEAEQAAIAARKEHMPFSTD